MFDRKHKGFITVHEIRTIMRTLGFNPTDAEIQNLCMTVDYDGKFDVRTFCFLKIQKTQNPKDLGNMPGKRPEKTLFLMVSFKKGIQKSFKSLIIKRKQKYFSYLPFKTEIYFLTPDLFGRVFGKRFVNYISVN